MNAGPRPSSLTTVTVLTPAQCSLEIVRSRTDRPSIFKHAIGLGLGSAGDSSPDASTKLREPTNKIALTGKFSPLPCLDDGASQGVG